MNVLRPRLEIPVGMGMALAGGAGLLGGVVGDIFGSSSAQATNQMNMQIAQMNNQFNAQQAALNRSFQENMADTQIQRRVADLKAANINPLLGMASGQGAAAPSGSSAQAAANPQLNPPGQSFSNLGQVMSGAASSAMQAYSTSKQADLMTAQTDSANMDAYIKSLQAPYAAQQAQANAANATQLGANLIKESYKLGEQGDLTREQVVAQMQDNEFRNEVIPLLVKAQAYETEAKRLGLPSLYNQADFANSPLGKLIPMLQQAIVPGSQAISNIGGALKDVISSILQFMPQVQTISKIGSAGQFLGGAVRSTGRSAQMPVNP